MIELLIVIVVGSVLTISVVAMFVNQSRTLALNEDLVDLEQNLRIGMDLLTRDVRMAGSYLAQEMRTFDVGDIDCNGDGVHGDCRSDDDPSNLAIMFSDSMGPTITNVSPGAAQTNVYFCADPSFKDPSLPPTALIPIIFSDDSNFGEWDIVNNKISIGVGGCSVTCPGTSLCSNITFPSSTPGSFTPSPGGHIWPSVEYVVYSVDDDYDCDGVSDGDFALIRQRTFKNDSVCSVVAFGINDMDVGYNVAGVGSTQTVGLLNTVTLQQEIERLDIKITGETRNMHHFFGESKKYERSLETEVQVRNLNLD